MAQVRLPLLSGIVSDSRAEFLTSYPVNLEVVATDNRIAQGQFRAPAGAIQKGSGPGKDRGGFLWNGSLYRVMGTKLVKINAAGAVTVIGDVGGADQVRFDESFSRLIIRSNKALWYYDGTTLTKVTDPDLGSVIDCMWMDGYTMATDGTYIVVTELSDPFSVKPLKYGSAEEDPDAITGLIKIRGEAYVLGRYTIQLFENAGGNGFPFQTNRAGLIPAGCVGPNAKCHFSDSFAFVGSGKNEALGVYLAGDGAATRISTRAIDDELAKVVDPAQISIEARTYRAERRLLVHLPDKTLMWCLNATKALQQDCWHILQSGRGEAYRLRHAVHAYGDLWVGDLDSEAFGVLSEEVSTHFGEPVQWQFDVGMVYNDTSGGILTSVELTALPGRGQAGCDGVIFMAQSRDGFSFGAERAIPGGCHGDTRKRLIWRPRSLFRNTLSLRFRGYDAMLPGFVACMADIEPLA